MFTEATVANGSPTIRMRQLGMEMRRRREEAGKNLDEAADWINLSDSMLSRMETGNRRFDVSKVRDLCQLYGVESPHIEALIQLARESKQRGWWADYGNTVPSYFADFLGMETAAVEMWTYEPEIVPGLFQTKEYAEAVAVADGVKDVSRFVQLRLARQHRLRDGNPLIMRAVLNEAVLLRQVGGRDVMRAQLRHLIDVSTLGNVTIQVLPFTAGAHSGMAGSFVALRFPEEPMNTVYVEFDGGAVYAEKPVDVQRYAGKFQQLSGLALPEGDTVGFLRDVEGRF